MTSKTIQRDLQRLDEEIARSRRMATFHEGDDEMLAQAYAMDADDLQAVRDRVEIWPGVGEVEVELELPGTVRVSAAAAVSRGSLRVGHSWHGVAADGSLTGIVELALPPVLTGFTGETERSRGLLVASRLEAATGGQVQKIRRITPADYRLRLQPLDGGLERVIHVVPQGTDAESAWCAAVADGSLTQTWADLRWEDRIVIGGGS